MNLFELLGINEQEMREFIVEAKKKGWACGKEEGNHVVYNRGIWGYEDKWDGFYSGGGKEIVTVKGKLIWQMGYFGSICHEFMPQIINQSRGFNITKRTFNFLRQALLHVTPKYPFRGPERNIFTSPDFLEFSYFGGIESDSENNLFEFYGTERIILNRGEKNEQKIFGGCFGGGLIIEKNRLNA